MQGCCGGGGAAGRDLILRAVRSDLGAIGRGRQVDPDFLKYDRREEFDQPELPWVQCVSYLLR